MGKMAMETIPLDLKLQDRQCRPQRPLPQPQGLLRGPKPPGHRPLSIPAEAEIQGHALKEERKLLAPNLRVRTGLETSKGTKKIVKKIARRLQVATTGPM